MNPNRFKPLIVLLCLLMAACAKDYDGGPPPGGNPAVTVEIEVGIPASNIPSLSVRSLTEADERRLHTVDLLLFEVDGAVEKYAARTHNTNNLAGDGGQTQTITANFEVDDTKQYRLVIFANLREDVDAALAMTAEGDLKEDVVKRVTFSHSSRWPARDFAGGDYRPLPMWGEADRTTTINKYTMASSFGTVKLLRSVALIQIGVNITSPDSPGVVSNGKDFFEIEQVKVFNSHRDGYGAPLPSAMFNGEKVGSPSIPSQARIGEAEMCYVMTEVNPYHENALYNTIYVNECVNAGQDMADAMYLIIKAYYTEPGAAQKNTTRPTWYRVDFYDRASDHPDADRIDILRNHSYLVNINYIGGPGEDSEEDAKNTLPVQLKADIVGWSDGRTTDVAWNGKYMLGVSKSHFELNNYGHGAEMFTVITNYPKGWTARVEDEWIQLDAETTFSRINVQDEFYFTVSANTGNPERIGYIILEADNLELKVKVEQSDDEVTIEVVDFYNVPVTERTFYSPKPNSSPNIPAELFIVRWSPADRDVAVTEEVFNNSPFGFMPGSAYILTHGEILSGGIAYYTIAPPDFTESELAADPFLEKGSRFHFTLHDQDPHSTNITLRHRMFNLLTDEADEYPLDGGLHSFTLRNNSIWEASVSDPNGILDAVEPLPATSGAGEKEGVPFYFRMADNSGGTVEDGSAVITFTYVVGYGETRTHRVVINSKGGGRLIDTRQGGLSNCYLLQPGSDGVKIPVRQANADGVARIAPSDQLDWKLVWTDHPNGIDAAGDGRSPVVKVELEGSGDDANIIVFGGSQPGNAVIGVTKAGSQDLLWSWHIWVTDFDPDDLEEADTYTFRNMTFMDRNLGSLVDDRDGSFGFGDPDFWGLFYQWGRKDPFPQAKSITSNEFRNIYDKDGNALGVSVVELNNVSGRTNLEYSVSNPTHYITMQWSNGDWYTSDWSLINNNLWFNGSNPSKTPYDPCPEGWRVPLCLNNAASPWNTLKEGGRTLTYHPDVYVLESSVLGYWPLGGLINRNDVNNFMFVGRVGVYWSAYPYTGTMTSVASYWYGQSIPERPASSGAPWVEYTSATSRVSGASVRCAKIE